LGFSVFVVGRRSHSHPRESRTDLLKLAIIGSFHKGVIEAEMSIPNDLNLPKLRYAADNRMPKIYRLSRLRYSSEFENTRKAR